MQLQYSVALREAPVSVLKEPEPGAGICVLFNTEEHEEQEGHGVQQKIKGVASSDRCTSGEDGGVVFYRWRNRWSWDDE